MDGTKIQFKWDALCVLMDENIIRSFVVKKFVLNNFYNIGLLQHHLEFSYKVIKALMYIIQITKPFFYFFFINTHISKLVQETK